MRRMLSNLLKTRPDWRRLLAVAAVALLGGGPARADVADDRRFSINGFGTLGVVRTNSDDAEFVRDLSQPLGARNEWTGKVDSVLGLQANWQFLPQWQAVVQGISRYRYDDSFRPEIAWAFVKYEPMPNLSLRVGRLGTEFFMMADSRWVGYSFLTVRPPGDFFWYLPFYSIHGGDAALTVPVGEHLLRGKLFYGISQGKIPLAEEQWDIGGSPMAGAYLEYQHGPWQLRASYANIRFERDLPYGPAMAKSGLLLNSQQLDYLSVRDKRSHYYSLGLVYDSGPWQAQLMLNRIEQGSKSLESSEGGYAQVGYRVGRLTPFVGYSRVYSKGRALPADPVIAYIVADSRTNQRTWYAGLRWDVVRNVALTAQWDGIRGDPTSIFPYRRENRATWQGDMNVFSLALDFVF